MWPEYYLIGVSYGHWTQLSHLFVYIIQTKQEKCQICQYSYGYNIQYVLRVIRAIWDVNGMLKADK